MDGLFYRVCLKCYRKDIEWKNQRIHHAHKKGKLTKSILIYDCNSNPVHCTMLYDLVFHPFSLYRYESVMLQCWNSSSDERPTFSELIVTIENILTSMANYIDFNQFTLEVEEQKGQVIFIYNLFCYCNILYITHYRSTTDEESSEL